ncbi:TERF1-interacting nuclear factor 2 isoform X3 [Anolis carolinensis]|uniref:TERF1 interacting nuclear factor 2 n=1 Tax=Anolis carolinensis TaxID=28377 RepID=H9G8H1_ANOCA|nr:PREDICTED: TERF1-interacting nuclear factor 2 isoform X2 [Anolis carolinensis]|eukprot:XP_008117766.1 PREDICTED: TERF1-interacting nuclear factor 2 isoform X2 [Anolis carolinensis]
MLVEEEEEEEEGPEGHNPFVALRLVAAASWHVVKERQVCDFPRVLAMLEAVGEAAPDLVHFRHLAKVRLGLQAKIIMTMLQNEEYFGHIYGAVDAFFPEHNSTVTHPKATAEDLQLVQAAQNNFRDLVLNLLSDHVERDKYVQEHLENDYGEAFSNVVEELFCDYLWQLERTLPKPDYQKLLEAVRSWGPRNNAQMNSAILSRYFTVMGYQLVGITARLSTSNPPSPARHSEGEVEMEEPSTPPEPCQARSNLGRSVVEPSCFQSPQERDSQEPQSSSQETGITERLSTSSPSSPPCHSVEEVEMEEPSTPPEPCEAPSHLGRSVVEPRCLQWPQERDSQELYSSSQETDESFDLVLDSSSEGLSSPFWKGEYQCTRHNTLIPTFQEHLRGPGSRCVRCSDSLTQPET